MRNSSTLRRLGRLAPGALPVCLALLFAADASAQSVTLNIGADGATAAASGSQSLTTNVVGLIAITTLLALAPGLLVVATAFTRIVVAMSMLRTALGLQQTPPNSVIIALSLFLAGFVMAPTLESVWRDAAKPLMDGAISEEMAADRAIKPFRTFMEANVRPSDLALFSELATRPPRDRAQSRPTSPSPTQTPSQTRERAAEAPLYVLAPAFLVSELTRAFQIGFLLFLPFLAIDIAVSAVLMGMGMMMLPPTVVSLPFKLVFFVLVDGWGLIAGALVRGFNT